MDRTRLKGLDGLRCVAAVAVMASHYEGLLSFGPLRSSPDTTGQYTHLCLLGVELFFMISGFVIVMSAERASSPTAFLWGRVARIYPAYLISIVPAALAVLAIYGPSTTFAVELLIDPTMLQHFANIGDLVKPYWTLAYEVWFYLVMAVILQIGMIRHIVGLSLAWLIVFLPVHAMDHGGILHFSGRVHLLTFVDFGSFFIIGIMCYLLASGRRSPMVLICLILATVYNGLGRWDWAQIAPLQYFVATVLFAVLLLLAATSRLAVMEAAPFVWIGQRSYSLYLLHLPIGFLLWAVCGRLNLSPVLIVLIGLPLSIGLAALSRHRIEGPGQRLIASIALRRPIVRGGEATVRGPAE